MRTAFFANGPMFKKGHINQPILATDIYILFRQILCLSPLPSPGRGLFQIQYMLDLTSLSNTCSRLYLSSVNMIQSIASKPSQQNISNENDDRIVQVSITEKQRPKDLTHVHMHVIVDD